VGSGGWREAISRMRRALPEEVIHLHTDYAAKRPTSYYESMATAQVAYLLKGAWSNEMEGLNARLQAASPSLAPRTTPLSFGFRCFT